MEKPHYQPRPWRDMPVLFFPRVWCYYNRTGAYAVWENANDFNDRRPPIYYATPGSNDYGFVFNVWQLAPRAA